MTQTMLKPNRALRDARAKQGLSLRTLAHFSRVSHTTVARIERGDLDVAPAIKARIARALRVPVAELWPLDDPTNSDAPVDETEAAQNSGRQPRHEPVY
jgi:transcriptional regulator with XRE-family HTH domain